MRRLLSLLPLAALAACDLTATIEHPGSIDEVAFEYEIDGDMAIPRPVDDLPLPLIAGPRVQVVYLDVDGATIRKGDWREDNAPTETSFIPGQAISVVPPLDPTPWGGDRAAIARQLADFMRIDFAGFDVRVTVDRPASGPYTTVLLGGRPPHLGLPEGPLGIAPLDAENWNQSDVVFVFTEVGAQFGYDLRHMAWTAAHELGHSLGLTHAAARVGIMAAVSDHGPQHWTSSTIAGEVFRIQDDLAVLTGVLPRVAGAPPGPPCGRLAAGEALLRGREMFSCDGGSRLVMQTDGNLVLYRGGGAPWASHTWNTNGERAVVQTDGNLVVYGAADAPLFAMIQVISKVLSVGTG